MDVFADHARKCEDLSAHVAAASARGQAIALGKPTSNLFRERKHGRGTTKVDVRALDNVLCIDPIRRIAVVEGMITFEALVDQTLQHGLLPAVVPQLKTITVGGAVSGLGIESSSFRFGLVHETVEEMEILLGDGRIIVCSPQQNSDLFYGFPNSYGTLGYTLRLTIRLIPSKRYVHMAHLHFSGPHRYFAAIAELCSDPDLDYVDGTVFGGGEMYVTTGHFCDDAPRVSDYTYMRIYYRSIPKRKEDWLTTRDYIWRWDTDWFWCSKHFYVQHPLLRALVTKWALNSRVYQRIMRASQRVLSYPAGKESVIQDVDIPITKAEEFLEFLLADIGIRPIWVCPFRAIDPHRSNGLYALDPGQLYINFGLWDIVPTSHESGYFNKAVEQKAIALNGKKALYSTSYYDEPTFWAIYNKTCYDELKRKYDPSGFFSDLYAKCVLRK